MRPSSLSPPYATRHNKPNSNKHGRRGRRRTAEYTVLLWPNPNDKKAERKEPLSLVACVQYVKERQIIYTTEQTR